MILFITLIGFVVGISLAKLSEYYFNNKKY